MANFVNYNLIFRYPWLIKVDLKIHFKTGTFEWWNNQELKECISLISLKDILDDIALGEIVYALYLKKYQIQPLFYGKTGIKLYINKNISITDTL